MTKAWYVGLSVALFCIAIPMSGWAKPSVGALIQKKYAGLPGQETLVIEGKTVQLVPAVLGAVGEQRVTNPAAFAMPYLVVNDDDYLTELKKRHGYHGKPANHVEVRGKETVIIKASEVDTRVSSYPGIAGAPANHVVIDGVRTVLVPKSEYYAFLKRNIGIADLPANYIMVGKEIVQIVPVNSDKHIPMSATCEKVTEEEVICQGRRYARDTQSIVDSGHSVNKVVNQVLEGTTTAVPGSQVAPAK